MTEIIVLYLINYVYKVYVFFNETLLAFQEVDIWIKNISRVKECDL